MRLVLKLVWCFLIILSLGASALFVQGLRRDLRVGEPSITLELVRGSELARESFRVRRWGSYTLFLTSVNHTPPYGVPFEGELYVRVVNPVGGPVFEQRFAPGSTGHRRPDNVAWTPLASLRLPATGVRRWRLEAQVIKPDRRFAGVSSRVLLREERADPGMGGLMNYVMPIPALASALFALLVAALIAKRGEGKWPLGVSALYLAAWLAALVGMPASGR